MAKFAGIDLGGTKIQTAVIEADDHTVLGASRRPTPLTGGPPAIAQGMVDAVREAAVEARVELGELLGVGVGSPGVVDAQAGTVSSAMNLDGWSGTFALRDTLQEALGAPVAIGNDVDLATRAEYEIGAAKDAPSLLGVFWGTGVGGGIILPSGQWVGRGSAGEIGHMVVKQDGHRCPCGRRGCLEAYAGRGAMQARAQARMKDGEKTVLFEIMKEKGRDRLTSGIWERALRRDDALARDLLEDAVAALGAGVASAVNLLDPHAVVIGGGLGLRLGEPWLEKLRAAMLPHLFVDDDPPPVVLAALGDLGGAHGGALLAEGLVAAHR